MGMGNLRLECEDIEELQECIAFLKEAVKQQGGSISFTTRKPGRYGGLLAYGDLSTGMTTVVVEVAARGTKDTKPRASRPRRGKSLPAPKLSQLKTPRPGKVIYHNGQPVDPDTGEILPE